MNNFSIVVHRQWKLHSVPIEVVMLWWLWNFAHAHGITSVLLWHVQNFVAIWMIAIEWNYIKSQFFYQILILMEKKLCEIGSWTPKWCRKFKFILMEKWAVYPIWPWLLLTGWYKEPQQPRFLLACQEYREIITLRVSTFYGVNKMDKTFLERNCFELFELLTIVCAHEGLIHDMSISVQVVRHQGIAWTNVDLDY